NLNTEVAIQVLESASEGLHALGRLSEALQAAKSLASAVPTNRQHDITNAAIILSEISILLGRIYYGMKYAETAVSKANCDKDFTKKIAHVVKAIALHESGDLEGARDSFHRAESFEKERKDGQRFLRSLQGYAYCELLLDFTNRYSFFRQRNAIL